MISEALITKTVLAHWRTRGLPNTLVASIPNMAARGQYGLTPGLPDLLVLSPSLPIGLLELKTERGSFSPAQRHIHDLCARIGAPAAASHGLDEALAALEAWGVIRSVA